MTAMDLLTNLTGREFTIAARDGSIVVAPASGLTASDRDALRHHKPALLALLKREKPPPAFFWMYPEGKNAAHHMGEGGSVPLIADLYTWEGAGSWFRPSL